MLANEALMSDVERERKLNICDSLLSLCTCSGLRPGGTQTYSSSAHPESSSEVEFLCKSYISLVMVFSISRDMAVTTCSSTRTASVDTGIPVEETDKKVRKEAERKIQIIIKKESKRLSNKRKNGTWQSLHLISIPGYLWNLQI